jgi:hypothetical protein
MQRFAIVSEMLNKSATHARPVFLPQKPPLDEMLQHCSASKGASGNLTGNTKHFNDSNDRVRLILALKLMQQLLSCGINYKAW